MVEVCLKRLTALNKPFKYVVTCVIMQKNGAGLHTASSCYWDNTTDGEWGFCFISPRVGWTGSYGDAPGT